MIEKLKIGVLVTASLVSTAFGFGGTWYLTKADIASNAARTTKAETQIEELNKEREAHAKQLIEIKTTADFTRQDVAEIKRGVERIEDRLGTRP